jgi:hypothetical protein
MSIRQQVAQNLADTCVFGGLNDSYGVNVEKSSDPKSKKTFWSVTFAVARVTDGVIRVYSPNFIMIKWQTADRTLRSKGQEIFHSEDGAKTFLIRNFVKA